MRPRDCRYASLRQRTNRTDFASILNQHSPIGVRSGAGAVRRVYHQAPAAIALGVKAVPITSDRRLRPYQAGLMQSKFETEAATGWVFHRTT
jgi:hypothetical protein